MACPPFEKSSDTRDRIKALYWHRNGSMSKRIAVELPDFALPDESPGGAKGADAPAASGTGIDPV